MDSDWDLLVIGGGTAGMSAVRAAHRPGRRVALVQNGPVGGDCTFTGCVPSKTLIESAAQGLSGTAALKRVKDTVAAIAATETADVLRSEGIPVLEDEASFESATRLRVGSRQLNATRVIIATGSQPSAPPVDGLADVDHLTNETIFTLRRAPSHLLILGGGPIGCELAQAFARLGAAVTVVEVGDRLLAKEEPQASAVVTTALLRAGVTVRTGTRATSAQRTPDGPSLTLEDGSTVTGSHLLVAAGRRASVDGLNLERAGVMLTDAGHVLTSSRLATSVRGIFAAGDVTGKLPFTHAADAMGRTAAINAFAPVPFLPFSTGAIPWVTFTTPEVGRVGLTEAEAYRKHSSVQVAELPMSEVDRARTAGETEGFIKLIVGPKLLTRGLFGGRVLGATAVCSRGGELIHEAALAMKTGMFAGRLAQTTHAYPTWSLAVQQTAAQFFIEMNGRKARPARPV